MTNKKILTNVAIIRPILIVLLVFYHSFVIFQGGWGTAGKFPNVEIYWWLDKLSYAFMLETFVFISGYVFGYQVGLKGESKLNAKNLIFNKFKRLIIPSMFFSFLYIVFLLDINQPIHKTLYEIVEGVGHMWFLPMLFWCFICVWAIEKLKLKTSFVLILLILSSACSFVQLPLQINATMYYMLFFYIGYILQRKNINLEKYYTCRNAIIFIALFLVLFPLLTLFREYPNMVVNKMVITNNQFITKIATHLLSNIARIIYSSIGLFMLLVLIGMFEKNRTVPLPKWIVDIGGLCMGVYLFQQFILQGIYFHTNIPCLLSCYWLPWIGFILALLGSLFLSYIFRLTKIGRFFIG